MKTKYYQLTGEQALAELKSSANGLTEAEVKARQEAYNFTPKVHRSIQRLDDRDLDGCCPSCHACR